MATNKNALIRYLTIDKCLQNHQRKWTLLDLIDACSDALYEAEGKDTNVSKRTVQLDIQTMRSDNLGYNAPIVIYDKKYYTYSQPNYSITDIPITSIDLDILQESVEMLRQFKNFSLFSELDGVIQKLEDKVYRETKDQSPIIHLDKNEHLKGIEHLDVIYQAILKKCPLRINYQSFKARESSDILLSPYILKEYNNRWFAVGKRNDHKLLLTLALDRINDLTFDPKSPFQDMDFDADQHYKNTIGVTVHGDKDLIDIELKVSRSNAPYVLTKPFHPSQKLIGEFADGAILISLRVHHNYELERLVLGFGPSITVLKPQRLRTKIQRLVQRMHENYSEESV